MTPTIDHTHDRRAQSWVGSANLPHTDFPIQNLPLGVFGTDASLPGRIGVAIGEQILDLAAAVDAGLLPGLTALAPALRADDLNPLMALGRRATSALRLAVFDLLREGSAREAAAARCLVPMGQVQMRLPARIGDFTDFFTSLHHVQRTGRMVRPDDPVALNFRHMPIAYHGRASSVVVSGVRCVRPKGQVGAADAAAVYVPTRRLDFEIEVGCFIGGPGNPLGSTIAIDDAEDHMFGFCLVNDWSARDIQRWESFPLGPFLAKSFMTSVSPWVVMAEALAPFRVPAPVRGEGEPPLSGALSSPGHAAHGGISISLQVLLQSAAMRQAGMPRAVVSRPQFSDQYWTLAQMLTHHASNGCNLRTADLLSSGTVSGPEQHNSGCMIELTAAGTQPLKLPSGELRGFIEDGDTVCLRGVCEREGFRSIGFGECQAQIEEAR